MSLNRYAKQRDGNESELIKFAEGMGAECVRTDKPLDYWVGWRGAWYPMEVKLPEREGRANEFTAEQVLFMARARDCRLPVWVWRTEGDVMKSLGARRSA